MPKKLFTTELIGDINVAHNFDIATKEFQRVRDLASKVDLVTSDPTNGETSLLLNPTGNFSSVYQTFTNLAPLRLGIKTNGNPVWVGLLPISDIGEGYFSVFSTFFQDGAGVVDVGSVFQILRDGSPICQQSISHTSAVDFSTPVTFLQQIDSQVPGGTHVYQVRAAVFESPSIGYLLNCVLAAFEIRNRGI